MDPSGKKGLSQVEKAIEAVGEIPLCAICSAAKNVEKAGIWSAEEVCKWFSSDCDYSSDYAWADQVYAVCIDRVCGKGNKIIANQCANIVNTIISDKEYAPKKNLNCGEVCTKLGAWLLPLEAEAAVAAPELIATMAFMCPKVCETAIAELHTDTHMKDFGTAMCDLMLDGTAKGRWGTAEKRDPGKDCQLNGQCKSGFCGDEGACSAKKDQMGFLGGWPATSWPKDNCKPKGDELTEDEKHTCAQQSCQKWLNSPWGRLKAKESLAQACASDFGKKQCPETCCRMTSEETCSGGKSCTCDLYHSRMTGLGCGENSDCLSNYCASPVGDRSCQGKDGPGCVCLDCPENDCSARPNGVGCAHGNECLTGWCASPKAAAQCEAGEGPGCSCEDKGNKARTGRTAQFHPECGVGAGKAGFAPDAWVCPNEGGEFLSCCQMGDDKTDLCMTSAAQTCGLRLQKPEIGTKSPDTFWVGARRNRLGMIDIECSVTEPSSRQQEESQKQLEDLVKGCAAVPGTTATKWQQCDVPGWIPLGPGPVKRPSRPKSPAPTPIGPAPIPIPGGRSKPHQQTHILHAKEELHHHRG